MNNITIFENDNFGKIRMVEEKGEPWFVLADLCKVLELSNPSKVAQRLDEDERSNFKLGRQGYGVVVNESGMYAVILRSDKPQAKPFRKWVTSEVLPSIRKTGNYTVHQTEEIRRRNLEVREMTRGRGGRKFSSDWLLRPQTILSERLSWQTRQILQSEQIFCLFRSWRGVHIRQKKSARN